MFIIDVNAYKRGETFYVRCEICGTNNQFIENPYRKELACQCGQLMQVHSVIQP